VVARVVVAAVAIVLIGWLAVLEHDTRLYDSAIAAGRQIGEPAVAARVQRDLEDARALNPDRTPDIARGVFLRNTGRAAAGRAVLEDVLRDEPDNLTAWRALALVGGGPDARVQAQLRRLDPLSADRARQGR
jgi:predicted Zn-dependent protease